jgi:hypothetical protein
MNNDAISKDDARRLLNYFTATPNGYGTGLVDRWAIDVIMDFMQRQSPESQRAFRAGLERLMSELIGVPQNEQEEVLEAVRRGIAPNQTYQQSMLDRPDQPKPGEQLTMIQLSPKERLFLSQHRIGAAWMWRPNEYLIPVDHQRVVELLRQQPNLMNQAKNITFEYYSPYHPVYFFRDQSTGKSFSIPSEEQIRQYLSGYTSQQPVQQNTQPFASEPLQPPIPGQTQQNAQPFAPKQPQLSIPGRTQQRQNAGRSVFPSY